MFYRKIDKSWQIKEFSVDHVNLAGLSGFINKDVKVDDVKNSISFSLHVPKISGTADFLISSIFMIFDMNCCDAPVTGCKKRPRPCNSTISIEDLRLDVEVGYEIAQSFDKNVPDATLALKNFNMTVIPGDTTEWIDVDHLNGGMGTDSLNRFQKRLLALMNKFLIKKVSYHFLKYRHSSFNMFFGKKREKRC